MHQFTNEKIVKKQFNKYGYKKDGSQLKPSIAKVKNGWF